MSTFIKNCTGTILAGGENTRMPVLKAFIKLNGERIIERNLKLIKNLFDEVFIVTNQPEAYIHLGVQLLGDVYDVRGPITGIFTALTNASNKWVFISACDMPFIKEDLIRYAATKRDNYDAVVPVTDTKIEPLFAFYSKQLLPSMEKAILESRRGMKDFLNHKKVKYITAEEIRKLDAEGKTFINLNTPEDIYTHLKPRDTLKFS